MEALLKARVSQRQFLKWCGLAMGIGAAGAAQLATPPKVAFATQTFNDNVDVYAAGDGGGVSAIGSTSPVKSPGFKLYDGGTLRGGLGLAEADTRWSTSAVTGDLILRADTGKLHLLTGTGAAALSIASGSVGIGTASPELTLHVSGNEILSTGGGAGFKFRDRGGGSGDNWVWYSSGNVARLWRQSTGDVIGVTTGGNVGIGMVNPGARLHVKGAAGDATDLLRLELGSSAETRLVVNPYGGLVVGGSAVLAQFTVYSTGTGVTGAVIKAANGQTADLLQVRSYPGTNGDLLTVTAGGRVGIGATSPANVLHVKSGNSAQLSLEETDSGGGACCSLISPGGTVVLGRFGSTHALSNKFGISVNGGSSQHLVIDNVGNVGIGRAVPQYKLHVAGDLKVDGTLYATVGSTTAVYAQ